MRKALVLLAFSSYALAEDWPKYSSECYKEVQYWYEDGDITVYTHSEFLPHECTICGGGENHYFIVRDAYYNRITVRCFMKEGRKEPHLDPYPREVK